MRSALVPLLVAALAAPAAADEPLVTTGELVMTKKGPAFRGQSAATGSDRAAASFDVEQTSYGARIHLENVEPGQRVWLGGGPRDVELTAQSTGADGAPIETTWVLSGKAKRKSTKRAVGEHRRKGRLVAREVVTVTRKRAVHTISTFGQTPTVRREELRRATKKQAKRGRR